MLEKLIEKVTALVQRKAPDQQAPFYEYQLKDTTLDFQEGVSFLGKKFSNPIVVGTVDNNDADSISRVLAELTDLGISASELKIDAAEYSKYVGDGQYKRKYGHYYVDNFPEKTLEHFLCYTLLDLQATDTFVDIASESSPVGEIFHDLTGCHSYSQDIMYEPGVHGNKIGSDAAEIPVEDLFFDAAIATCSIEHFEQNSDRDFIKEMGRVLKSNGRLIIVPLYLHKTACCQTDPTYSVPGNVVFDNEVEIYCAQGWGNRHGRFYSPQTLVERLIQGNDIFCFHVYVLKNPHDVDDSIYCRYILVGDKKNR